MESRNPIFSKSGAFNQQQPGYTPSAQQLQDMYGQPAYAPPVAGRAMTLDDVVVRGALTLGTLVVSAGAAWALKLPLGIALVAMLVGLGLGLWVSFKQSTNPALILGYAVSYGVVVGVVSRIYEELFHGIVLQAVAGTALAFGGMLAVHAFKIIRVTPKFTRFVVAAGFALFGLMLINLLASFFVEGGIGIRSGGPLAIVFSVVAILVGCFFLLLDFDMIEKGVQQGAPERFAWLCAFGLTVSLVWIYLEILRLLSYFYGND